MIVAAAVIFMNGTPFMVSVSRGINFTMVEYFSQGLKTVINNYIWKIFQLFKNNGYTMRTFLMDREFE